MEKKENKSKSESRNTDLTIYQRLSNLRKSVLKITRNAKGYGYTYVSLDSLLEKVTPLLEENGLVLSNTIESNMVKVTLLNVDNPKEMIQSSMELTYSELLVDLTSKVFDDPAIKFEEKQKFLSKVNSTQQTGAEITYFTRYMVMTILGLCATDDKDAERPPAQAKAQNNSRPTAVKTKTPEQRPPKIMEINRMIEAFKKVGVPKDEVEAVIKIENMNLPGAVTAEKWQQLRDFYGELVKNQKKDKELKNEDK